MFGRVRGASDDDEFRMRHGPVDQFGFGRWRELVLAADDD
jgi:hypothetical protein